MTRKRMIVAVLAAALCTGVAVTDSLARGGGGGGGGGHGGGFGGGGHGGGFGGGHMAGFGGGHFGGGHFGGAHFGGRALGHVGRIGGLGRGVHGFHGTARASMHGGHVDQAAHHALHNNLAGHSGLAGRHQQAGDHALSNRNAGRNGRENFVRTRNGFGNERGWQHWRNSSWAHDGDRRGGFGWYGPVFWPYGYGDVFSYVFSPYDYEPFWDYDFGGLLTSLFYGPSDYSYGSYAYGDNIYDGGYSVDSSTRHRRRHVARATPSQNAPSAAQIAATCSGLAPGVTDLPTIIDKAVRPTQSEGAAFDDVNAASARAAEVVEASCPSVVPLTPLGRLDAVQKRTEALIQAVQIVRSPLDRLYAGLSDEQKQRLDGLGNKAGQQAAFGQSGGLTQICNESAPGYAQPPIQRIEQVVRPTAQQRSALDGLKDTSAKAADALKSSCPTTFPSTAASRLDAVEARLEAMDQAVKAIRPALDTFYTSLTDEQKARFNTMGQSQSGTGQIAHRHG